MWFVGSPEWKIPVYHIVTKSKSDTFILELCWKMDFFLSSYSIISVQCSTLAIDQGKNLTKLWTDERIQYFQKRRLHFKYFKHKLHKVDVSGFARNHSESNYWY